MSVIWLCINQSTNEPPQAASVRSAGVHTLLLPFKVHHRSPLPSHLRPTWARPGDAVASASRACSSLPPAVPPCPPLFLPIPGAVRTFCASESQFALMPSLGFLKKKRTREADPSATASQPTSPITPTTTARSFDNSTLPTSPSTQSVEPPQKVAPAPRPLSEGAKVAMNPATAHLAAPYNVTPPAHSPSPGTDPQNLPSIANLINPPQHDGAQQSTFAPPAQSQSLNQGRFPQPPANGQSATGAQPSAAMAQQQPAQALQAQQAAAVQQQQQQQQQQQSRQTKGKYSLVDFDILRTLGTGSFGRVHLVQSKHNSRFYAVKVLKKAQVVKMKQVEHTNDERKMLGEVKHPFLITLWGTFQDSRNLYMVMDFVEGGELFSLLRKSGVRPPS